MNYFLPWQSTSTMNGSFMHLWSESKKLLRECRNILCLRLEHCLPSVKPQLHLCAPWKRYLLLPRVGRTAVTEFWWLHIYCISSWKSGRKSLLFRCVTIVLPAVGIFKFLLRFLINELETWILELNDLDLWCRGVRGVIELHPRCQESASSSISSKKPLVAMAR